MKKISCVLLALYGLISSQVEYLNLAQIYFQNNKFDSAKKYIDIALTYPEIQRIPYAYLLKGEIYRGLYKKYESELTGDTQLRINAINAYRQYMSMVDSTREPNNYRAAKLNGKAVSSWLYNSAQQLVKEGKPAEAIELFQLFESSIYFFDPNFQIKEYKVNFTARLARFYHDKYDKQPVKEKDPDLFQKALNAYIYALELDSTDMDLYFNIGVLYYNNAAEIAQHILPYEDDLGKQLELYSRIADYVLKALPYLRKYYEFNKNELQAVRALASIYYYLNNFEEAEYFSKEAIRIQKEQGDRK